MSFEEALESLSRDERFKATVYAMDSLLIEKGIYTQQEFAHLFAEWAGKRRRVRSSVEVTHGKAASV